jgi:hypothetical protein
MTLLLAYTPASDHLLVIVVAATSMITAAAAAAAAAAISTTGYLIWLLVDITHCACATLLGWR